jgi:hypothetical protein
MRKLSQIQTNILISLDRGDKDFGEHSKDNKLIKRGWFGGNSVRADTLINMLTHEWITPLSKIWIDPEDEPRQRWTTYRITQKGRTILENQQQRS